MVEHPPTLLVALARQLDSLRGGGLRALRRGSSDQPDLVEWTPSRAALCRAEEVAETCERLGIDVWYPGHAHWPAAFEDLDAPPAAVFARGSAGALAKPCLAVVGSRDADGYGVAVAAALGRAFGAAGACVVSGGALGVDAAAHRGALDARGTTVAVLAGGLDRPSPATHRPLFEGILRAGGLLLSEAPPGLRPSRWSFPRRNRLVAALARAVVVAAAGPRSGTRHTVRWARALGRPVLAVPADVGYAGSEGSNALLAAREARALVHPDQALGLVGLQAPAWTWPRPVARGPGIPPVWVGAAPPGRPRRGRATCSPAAHPVLAALGTEPLAPEVVAERTGLAIDEVLAALVELELEGRAVRLAGNRFCRRPLTGEPGGE